MPPKNSKVAAFTIRCKRKSYTYFILCKPNEKLIDLKKILCETVNGVGGLVQDADVEDMEKDDDVDIPVPSFETAENSESETEEKPSIPGGEIISPKDIKIAIPLDRYNLYDEEEQLSVSLLDCEEGKYSKKVNEKSSLEDLGFHDNQVLVFALNDEEFDVLIPQESE